MSGYPRLAAMRAAADAATGRNALRLRTRYLAALDALPGALDPAFPCVLLPVRLETRIRMRTDGAAGDELVCRIYPDDIHTDAHDHDLSPAEVAAGQHYWKQRWAAEVAAAEGRSEAAPVVAAAWSQLTARLTPPRAAWVARSLTPTNPPPSPDKQPVFPARSATDQARSTVAAALPDRWVVRLWRDEVRIGEGRGELIPRPLAMGPPPAPGDAYAPTAWLVNLDAALAMGMAVIVRPEPPTELDRVDVVTATGVRGADNTEEGAAVLRDLLDAHQFATGLTGPGLDLLAPGTPTNNTPAVRTLRRRDSTGTISRDAWLDPAAAARRDGSDADRLAAALGIADRTADDPTGEPFVLGRLPGAAGTAEKDAAEMAKALWPATWGYFLRQFAPGIAGLGVAPDLTSWRRFVVGTVRARGPLPTLRVREQPYGVLPVLDTAAWQPWPEQPELLAAVVSVRRGRPAPVDAMLQVGWDLDPAGSSTGGWTDAGTIPVDPGSPALDLTTLTLADGRSVLVALTTAPVTGEPMYRMSAPLAAEGTSSTWSDAISVPTDPTGAPAGGAGVTVARIGGRDALVVVATRWPTGASIAETTIRVGTGLAADGTVGAWSTPMPVPVPVDSAGSPGLLVGAAAADLGGDKGGEAVDIVLAWVAASPFGNEIVYRVGARLGKTGEASAWSDERRAAIPDGLSVAGAGIAVTRLGGEPALVLHVVAQPGGAGTTPAAVYLLGHGLRRDGTVTRWDGPYDTGEQPMVVGTVRGAPVTTAALGRRHEITTATGPGLVDLLQRMRADWTAAVPGVPRVGRAADPTDDLLDLFARDAVSTRVRGRGLLGWLLLANTWRATGRDPDLERSARELWEATRGPLAAWGLIDPAAPDYDDPAGKPLLGLAAYEGVATEVDLPMAGNTTAHALETAATCVPADLHPMRDWSGALLDVLARHTALQAWADAALLLRPPDAPPEQAPTAEPQLVDLADLTSPEPPGQTPTAWRHLTRTTFPAGSQWAGQPVWEGVADLLNTHETGGDISGYGAAGQAVVELAEVRTALRHLATRTPEELALLLGECLDLASHRLDAWVTAAATERLRTLRAAEPRGVHLGGWGAVVDLRRADGTGTEGRLHAPSTGQGVTAAVLRSGHLGDAGGGLLNLNLTSRRVRGVLELAAGVRAGQPLGVLLGYRFERAVLADPALGLGRYLPALRQIAPLHAGKREPLPAETAVEGVAADAVVDGLALVRSAAPGAASPIPWGTRPDGADEALPRLTTKDGKRLAEMIEDLRDAVDALGDVLVADAVHHLVAGSTTSAGGSLDVLAGGEVPPTDPAVTRTPRTGIAVTHRVLVSLPRADRMQPEGWRADAPRALAEPRLEAWVAEVLGSASAVGWRVKWPDSDAVASFSLGDLGLCALDLVALAADPAPTTENPNGEPAGRTELARLLVWHAAGHAPAEAVGEPRLLLDADPGWPATAIGVPDALALAAAVADLTGSARAATAADVAGPRGLPPNDGVDLTGTHTAATRAVDGLREAADALRADRSAASLARLVGYGVPHTAPGEPDGIERQVDAALAEADRRVKAANALAGSDPADALRKVFGEGFLVVPPFTPPPGEFTDGLTARAAAGDADPATLRGWLENVAHVRPGAARLADVRLLATSPPPLQVAQLPADVPRWAALPTPDGAPPPGGTVSLLIAGDVPDPAGPVAALLVDDWVEVVPGTQQDTSVVMQLNAPTAVAPQAVLLAVAANPAQRWTTDSLERVVLETLALARERAVDADVPGAPQSGHLLPALLFARNSGGDTDGDTISTEFPRKP
ncbi:hypothetical protein ACWGJT_31965 [Streptomyces xantholiticus]